MSSIEGFSCTLLQELPQYSRIQRNTLQPQTVLFRDSPENEKSTVGHYITILLNFGHLDFRLLINYSRIPGSSIRRYSRDFQLLSKRIDSIEYPLDNSALGYFVERFDTSYSKLLTNCCSFKATKAGGPLSLHHWAAHGTPDELCMISNNFLNVHSDDVTAAHDHLLIHRKKILAALMKHKGLVAYL